jgi:hypothetical protein
MSEVMCLAEDENINIIYQDTDSFRLNSENIGLLAHLFKGFYGRDLIGKRLGQLHSDYPEISKGVETYGVKGWYCGKKSYMDKVSNDQGDIAFVVRCKGIIQDVIAITSNQLYPKLDPVEYRNGLFYPRYGIGKTSIEAVFDDLYNGKAVGFDLCLSTKPCFDQHSNYSIETKSSFIRKIRFK